MERRHGRALGTGMVSPGVLCLRSQPRLQPCVRVGGVGTFSEEDFA